MPSTGSRMRVIHTNTLEQAERECKRGAVKPNAERNGVNLFLARVTAGNGVLTNAAACCSFT